MRLAPSVRDSRGSLCARSGRPLGAVLLAVSMLLLAGPGCATSGGDDDDDSVDARVNTDAGNGQCDFCSTSDKCCNGFCVDVQNSTMNCGDCNHACTMPTADGCSLGQCTCNFSAECTGETKCCENIGCKDLDTDKLNCGTCGHACPDPDNESCVGGECVCAATGGVCEGATPTCCSSGCANTQTDTANCGECGHSCGGTATCEAGACVYSCEEDCSANPDLTLPGCCSTGCVDLFLDAANCGACDNDCGAGFCMLGTCLTL